MVIKKYNIILNMVKNTGIILSMVMEKYGYNI